MELLKVQTDNQFNIGFYYALVISGIVLAGLLTILVPGAGLTFLLAGWVTIFVPVVVVAYNIANQKYFNILNIYSLIFLLEGFGGILAGAMKTPLPGQRPISENLLFQSLTVYVAGYLLFLFGFYLFRCMVSHREIFAKAQLRPKALPVHLTKSQWHSLFLILPVLISLGFIKVATKIRAADGITQYIYSMYQYRFGSFAEDVAENALVSLAGQLDNLALPLTMLGLAVWFSSRIPRLYRNILFFLLAILLFQKFTSGFRSVIFFTILSMIMVRDSVSPLKVSRLFVSTALLLVFLIGINLIHQYLYFLTAGWDKRTFLEGVARLVAPQKHLATLASVLTVASIKSPLYSEGLLESVFFFIPRVLWHTKAEHYGTIIVQQWAYLPDWYQMAPTNVGELIARFGYTGLLGMPLVGAVHGWLEGFHRCANPVMRMGYFCTVLPRLLVHLGMGISALSITIFSMALLYGASIFLGFSAKARRTKWS
jgi:hypothetical protein